ncbi:sulfatase-like hydrolase/transferase [Klebsiella sp. RHBSTW-00484]|uniref:sulfatase-like hydrolase/transferase n=1 Tax=unclassified Klebsiella TaxID=2608929 RepID=UPI0015E4F70C|nr:MULTISPECIES: sulfatase-like hydrolase/transferase [unclassified Klebsiella]QLO35969.1 sulfatase-like hydrolase/transferase [Klebsiella sp. RHBSTW-00484]QLT75485.1 sulfatase-like hydrolase/transferase [Klebsiella sp. RHBSTW-00464]
MLINNNLMSFVAMVLYISSYYFFFKIPRRNIYDNMIAVAAIILTIAFSLLTGCYLVANWFTGIGFDDSFFYHLRFGVEGAGISEYKNLILIFSIIQCIFLAVIIFFIRASRKIDSNKCNIKNVFLGFVISLTAYFCNPASLNLLSYFYSSQGVNDFSSYFIQPNVYDDVIDKKNILYFYLEGLEGTYMEETLFPGLLPELQKIKKESVAYTNIGQTIGASWTIAGMVSSQCGLPLLSIFTNNDFHMKNFMPNAICLGDILKSKGYHLEFMGAADTNFAGERLFYRNHGFVNVAGKVELLREGGDEKYTNSWGLFDDTFYSLLDKHVAGLNRKNKPWGLFSSNIGTHQPDGHVSRSCEHIKYGDGKHKLLNAIHCTDYLVGKLYAKLKSDGVLENTLVVFASDHLAPPSVNLTDTLEKKDRHNLFMLTGAGIRAGENERVGTTLDIAPTVLSFLGYGSQPFGLGRNLNGELTTLKEAFTLSEYLNQKLLSWRTVIDMAFWGYPRLTGRVSIDPLTQDLKIGDKVLKYPSLIRYTPQGVIQEVFYGSDSMSGDNRFLLAYYLVNTLSNSELFLWVDRCQQLSTLHPEFSRNANEYCFFNGSLASETSITGVIAQSDATFNVLSATPHGTSISRANSLRQKLRDANLVDWERFSLKLPKLSKFPFLGMQSTGASALVKHSKVAEIEMEESGLFLTRLSYWFDEKFGIKYRVDVIAKLDVCDKSKGPVDISVLLKNKQLDPTLTPIFYAIVGNVDESCRNGFSNLPVNVALTGLDKASIGAPFIALLNERYEVLYQKFATPDKTIALGVMLN